MYEIPQQLEYKEKIVFGLTFSQLAYAFLFSPIIFSLLFKINAPIQVRVILACVPALLASGFMFFDLTNHLRNWYAWFKTRELKGPEKISSILEIEQVKGGSNDEEECSNLEC